MLKINLTGDLLCAREVDWYMDSTKDDSNH